MKLYEISSTLLRIEQRIADAEDGESTLPLEEALSDWSDEFASKMTSIAGLIQTLQVEVNAQKEIIKSRQAAAKSLENRIDSLSRYAMNAMKATGILDVNTPDIRVRIKLGSGHVEIDDETLIPEDYRLFVPSSWSLDKAGLRADLLAKKKAGEPTLLPGAHLGYSEKLEIK